MSHGTVVEGEIKNITEFGLFSASTAMSTAWCSSDLDWKRSGEEADQGPQEGRPGEGAGCSRRPRKGTLSLGISSWRAIRSLPCRYQKGDPVTCEVVKVYDNARGQDRRLTT